MRRRRRTVRGTDSSPPRKTKQAVIEPGFTGDVRLCDAMNRKYYEEHQRGERTYEMSDGWHTDAVDGDYYVESSEEDGEHSVTCRLPMYTRAKQLIIKSGYTGNNPYVGYRRKAVVTFTATLEGNGEKFDIEKSTPVLQVRRVVNPTGIWRKHDSTKPFHVVLKHLPSETAAEFQTFSSEGAWRAYVVRGDRNFVTLDGGEEASGSTGSAVDFTVGFRGTCKADESRCAIVRVEYHNYSCYHLIFVRQGKAPMALYEGGTRWHACNMRTGTEGGGLPRGGGFAVQIRQLGSADRCYEQRQRPDAVDFRHAGGFPEPYHNAARHCGHHRPCLLEGYYLSGRFGRFLRSYDRRTHGFGGYLRRFRRIVGP